ncbi:MAG: N-acetylmuramoyl-L-alanine amidase [Bryobacterales bacterium]|nr:N-acetylmuramoyl-L-alanine amidase [Bryobacterales bacterium]
MPDIHRKDLIVLHFTAGTSCESAFRTWQTDPKRIATAYGVDPNGAIVEFFPPEAWAYHLGVKGTSHHDKRSIGIEIANVGPLQQDTENPDQLNWWPRNWGVPFCRKQERERYVQAEYRGMKYFAAMPQAQTAATAALVNFLCERFGIPKVASEEARRGDYNLSGFATYQGVASHSNFRRDKWDVGPAFRWDSLGF